MVRVQPYRRAHGTAYFKVSDCEFDDLPGQVEDALEFLKLNAEDLRTMMESGAKGSFDFAVHIPDQGFVTRSFPAPLVGAAGELGLGLDLSVYPGDEQHAV